jgi:hypothetical protein
MKEQRSPILFGQENGMGPKGTLHDPKGCTCFDGSGCSIPDYLNDLNAMHEAESMLVGMGSIFTASYVETLADGDFEVMCWWNEWWPAIRSTASQRSEAFLRTIGKWKY